MCLSALACGVEAVSLFLAACNGGGVGNNCNDFKDNGAITITTSPQQQGLGLIVVTQGACSDASCVMTSGSGCTVWEAEQTGPSGAVCRVGFLIPEDAGFAPASGGVVYDQQNCGGHVPQKIHL